MCNLFCASEFMRQRLVSCGWCLVFGVFEREEFGGHLIEKSLMVYLIEKSGLPDREDGADKVVGRGLEARLRAVGWCDILQINIFGGLSLNYG